MGDHVILVNPEDQVIGQMEKIEAHEKGVLHRAFSIFLFNPEGETLIQQRAGSKYHSPLLWTNTCCSHPRVGETIQEAAKRRLTEELCLPKGIKLNESFSFIYKAKFSNNLIEHELDHVLVGEIENYNLSFNKDEINSVKWVSLGDLSTDIEKSPEEYTEWFKIILREYLNNISK